MNVWVLVFLFVPLLFSESGISKIQSSITVMREIDRAKAESSSMTLSNFSVATALLFTSQYFSRFSGVASDTPLWLLAQAACRGAHAGFL